MRETPGTSETMNSLKHWGFMQNKRLSGFVAGLSMRRDQVNHWCNHHDVSLFTATTADVVKALEGGAQTEASRGMKVIG